MSGALGAGPVGAAVGNVRNDGPELVQPVDPRPAPPVQTELGLV